MNLFRIIFVLLYWLISAIIIGYSIKHYISDKVRIKKYLTVASVCLGLSIFFQALVTISNNTETVNKFRNISMAISFFIFPAFLMFTIELLKFLKPNNQKYSQIMNHIHRVVFILSIIYVAVQIIMLVIYPLCEKTIFLTMFGWRGTSSRGLFIAGLDFIMYFISLYLIYKLKKIRHQTTKTYSFVRYFMVLISITVLYFAADFIFVRNGYQYMFATIPFVSIGFIIILYRQLNNITDDLLGTHRLAYEILESLSEGVLFINAEYIIRYANKALYDMFGYNECILQSDIFSISKNDIQLNDLFTDFVRTIEVDVDSKKYFELFYTAKKDAWGDFLGGVFIFSDVTDLTTDKMDLKLTALNLEYEINKKNMELINTNNLLEAQLSRKSVLDKEYMQLARTDDLTNTVNRNHFIVELDKIIDDPAVKNFTVFSIDIDDFKNINDFRGHWFGDLVLIKVVQTITNMIDSEDVLSRISGDDFLLIARNITNVRSAEIFARLLFNELSKPTVIENFEILISVSIGISIFPDNGNISTELIKNAELANVNAREKGHNKYSFYEKIMSENALHDFKLTNEIKDGFVKHQFISYYQPQVKVDKNGNRKIIGYEALVRWNHPTKGVLTPGYFIMNAEKSGAIVDISYSVLRQTCLMIVKLLNFGIDNFKISVNICSHQLEDSNFILSVKKILEETNVDAKFIEFEITERSLLKFNQNLIDVLYKIKSLGITIAIDDFGVAFSSLNYIRVLPIDKIKVDKSFVDDIGKDFKNDQVLKTIIELAKSLGFKTVVEGVETVEQLNFLIENDCSIIQGFYFHEPVSLEEIFEKKILPVSNYFGEV